MTGPVEFEFEGRFDPRAVRARRGGAHERRCRHLRLPAQRHESEVIRRARRWRADVADAVVVNTCAVTGEAVAPGAPDHPAAPARTAGRAHRRHRLRRADRSADASPPCPKSTASLGNEEKLRRATWAGCAQRWDAAPDADKIAVSDIMAVTRRRPASRSTASRAAPAPSCRCRTAAITAAPSASFRSAAAIRARCRSAAWSRRCARLVEQRLPRDRADRRRHHELRRDLPDAPRLGALVKQILDGGAGLAAPAAVVDRFGRGRRRPARRASPTSRG